MKPIMIFSGTTEGRMLAEMLAGKMEVHVRVATEYGCQIMGPADGIDVQVGSCGGADGIADVVRKNGSTVVVDATHPYALSITGHIREGCAKAGAEYVRLKRSDSSANGAAIVGVPDIQSAVDFLKGTEGKILVTTGSNDIGLYTQIPGFKERVTARVLSTPESVSKCAELGFTGKNLIAAQGPFSEEMDLAMLRQTGAKYIVTKDSGTAGGYEAKVNAAAKAGATVVLIERPEEDGLSFTEVVSLIEKRFGITVQKKRTVSVIGIGMGPKGITVSAAERIRGQDVAIGARRMIDSIGFEGPVLEEYRQDEIVSYLDAHPEFSSAAVLMSGDIGFYSGASKLLGKLDRDRYEVITEPGISSVVYLCAKLGVQWQDVRLASSHGRDCNIVGLCRTNAKVFTLLSGEDSVHRLAASLSEYGLNVRMTVGENFGYPDERITSGTPEEISKMTFGDLCTALVENPRPDTSYPFGMADDDFIRGDAPMTKSEVRTLSVAKLKLSDSSIVYDVGAGTGSVSVEMARCAVNGTVYAIEKEDAAAGLIEQNKLKFGTDNITVIRGLAPEAMKDLPAPTHAFIGGSSGNLQEIIGCILGKNPEVRIVITCVTVETLGEISAAAERTGMKEEEIVCVNISKAKRAGRYHLMTAQNPVYIAVLAPAER